ncbi:hypothetical protein KDI_10560 [Dictyobacter arantiisoli]|uniref:Band 7 domain-containing protein n=1 Tax=Dictyobacter arantiisoli TaxID=2014874 RepID=A0A5A5T7X1_9CHLR|nr:hypothetical protein KDI_10560 [Dictyobacter arantiisoli]
MVQYQDDQADFEDDYAGALPPHGGDTSNARAGGFSSTTARTASSAVEALKNVSQYITSIAIPLVLGGLTCLIVLPQIASGHAVFPAIAFWPILLVILGGTLAQGLIVYYTGADHAQWILGTLGGFCFFLLLICFTLFNPLVGVVTLLALVALGVVLMRRYLHPVPEGMVDIVFSFKKYARTLYPGFNILLPWEEVKAQLSVVEVEWISPIQIVQISRDEDVMLRGVVTYQLLPEDAYLAITQVLDWQTSLRDLFQTILQSIPTVFQPDDFLIWPDGRHSSSFQPGDDDFTAGFERRKQIENFLFEQLRDRAALWGVQISWVSIRDIEIAPHGSFKIESVESSTTMATSTPAMTSAWAKPEPVAARSTQSVAHTTLPDERSTYQPAMQAQSITPPAEVNPHLSEAVLASAYQEVQNGKITDPMTIRNIAARFEAVAQNPELAQTVSFDPARAALNLYEQARQNEQEYPQGIYRDETQPELVIQRPGDESLPAAGS